MQRDVDTVPMAHIAGEPVQSRLQAEVVEHARAQAEGEIANGPEHLIDQTPALRHRVLDARIARGPRALDASQLHSERREHLGDMIVQLS